MLLSCLFFSVSAVMVRLVSHLFDSLFVSISRFLVGILLGVLVLLATKKPFRVRDKRSWVFRGLCGSVSMILYYLAISMTNSSRATLMNNLYILSVALLSWILTRKRPQANKIFSMVLCLCGVILIFYDGAQYSLAGDLVGILSGLIMGVAIHFTKRSSESEHPVIVYMSACLTGLVFIPFSHLPAAVPDLLYTIILLGIGAASFLAQLFMTSGYRHLSALRGSILSYLRIPMTMLLGILGGEVIGMGFYLGTLLLLAGVLVETGIPLWKKHPGCGDDRGVDKNECA